MNILGIDPGTACGWALRHADAHIIASGVWDLRPRRHEGGGMRYVRLRTHLREVLPECGMVAYEEVRRHMGVDAAHVYGGIVAMIAAECEIRTIPYTGITIAAAKQAATGKGNAKKDAMVASAKMKWPITIIDDNHADALWIAEAAARQFGNPEKTGGPCSR